MAVEKNDKNHGLASLLREKRKLLSPTVVQLFALCLGVVLTLSAFLLLRIFVSNMVKDEYERVAENTIETLVDQFAGFEPTVETVSAILFLSQDFDRRDMSEKVR